MQWRADDRLHEGGQIAGGETVLNRSVDKRVVVSTWVTAHATVEELYRDWMAPRSDVG